MSSAPYFHDDPSKSTIPTTSSSSVTYSSGPGLAPAAGGLAAAPPLIPSSAPITINVDRGTINVARDEMMGGHLNLHGKPGPSSSVGGPAADGPAQEVHPDEDVWEGGVVTYDDGRDWSRPRQQRPASDRVCGCGDLRKPTLWRAAIHEFVGTMLWVLYLCAGAVAVSRGFFSTAGVFWYSLFSFIILPLLVFSTSIASGGHLNPLITLATMFSGFTKFSRGFLYLIAQFGGAIVGAALLYGWLSEADQDLYGAGNCDAGPLSRSMALLVETAANFFWLFVVFGVALDPAQRLIFGRVLGPIFTSLAFGSAIFFTGLSGNYGGAWMHPGRCFGAAVISGEWNEEVWISIISWLMASLLMGVVYLLVPHNHELRSLYVKRRDYQWNALGYRNMGYNYHHGGAYDTRKSVAAY